jgi:integrase
MGRDGTGVRQVSATSIQIEFRYQGERCRERIKFNPSTTPADIAIKKAERHLAAINHAIDNGTFDYAVTFPGSRMIKQFEKTSDLTVGRWLEQWMDRKEAHLKASTYDGYVKAVRQLKDAFGHIKLVELKKKDVRTWCESKKASNKTISNLVSPLRAALQDAYEDELIPENPLFNFAFKRVEPPHEDKDLDPFSAEEEVSILSACEGHAHNLFHFAFWTGMRTSEMVALTWDDVDFQHDRIHIRRAKTQKAAKAETTKTTAGTRIIRMLGPARLALEAQQELTGSQGVVFWNPHDNLPWKGDQPIRKLWTLVLKRAGVRYRRPYQTRHTFASRMLSAGEPLAWISRHLGHSTVTMTEQVYAKYITGTHQDAGNKAVELFKGKDVF